MEYVKNMLIGYKRRQERELTRHNKDNPMHEMKLGEIVGLDFALNAITLSDCKSSISDDVNGFRNKLKKSLEFVRFEEKAKVVGTIQAANFAIELLNIAN